MFGRGQEVKEVVDELLQKGFPLAWIAEIKMKVSANSAKNYYTTPDMFPVVVADRIFKLKKDVDAGKITPPPTKWRVFERENRKKLTEPARKALAKKQSKQSPEEKKEEPEISSSLVTTAESSVMGPF
jgi:hypothetical protein